jgi:hypothetical protein
MDKKEFEFPDEKAEKAAAAQQNQAETDLEEGDVEVDIIDDTPEEDRGRKPLAKTPDEPSDEELQSYTAGVQQRIKELTHARHDERRAKEEAVRGETGAGACRPGAGGGEQAFTAVRSHR